MNRNQIELGINDMIKREAVANKIKRANLPLPTRPDETQTDIFNRWENMKRNYGGVANIPYSELANFLDEWAVLLSYARYVEAVSDIDQISSREIRDTIRKQLYVIQEGNRELRDAAVYTEPLLIEWQNKYIEDATSYTVFRSLREAYEFRLQGVSREITRRGSDNLDIRKTINRS